MKTCFKCNIPKPYSEFYRHSGMADGFLGKCKECTKNDSEIRRKHLTETDIEWVEKEAERQRKKEKKRYYEKLKGDPDYKIKILKSRKTWASKFPEKRAANLAAGRIKKSQKGIHNHHWSYKKCNWLDVIQIESKFHAFIHRYLKYDQNSMCYRTHDGIILDSRDKHLSYINLIKT